MKTTILAVGTLSDAFYRDAVDEYKKRLSKSWPLTVVEIAEARLPSEPSKAQIDAALLDEAKRMTQKIPARAYKIAMCVEGKTIPSDALSQRMEEAATRGASEIVFLIGSSFGLHESIKRDADFCLSLSPMTFPHALARVMLAEQIYRAAEIARGSRYHK